MLPIFFLAVSKIGFLNFDIIVGKYWENAGTILGMNTLAALYLHLLDSIIFYEALMHSYFMVLGSLLLEGRRPSIYLIE